MKNGVSKVYTDRPDYADFDSPAKFEAIKSIIAKRLREHPNAICSYSGGSDSDIMLDLIERTRAIFELPPIKYVFFNTGLEMKATRDHVKYVAEKYGVEIEEKIPAEPVTEEDVRSELYEEVSERTDIDIAREENQKAQIYLEMAEKEFGQNDIRIRKQKILVAALAGYIHDLDTVMNPPEEPEQPELPKLKNNDQRKEWLRNYKDWGLWYHDDRIDVNYYKYDFEDGSRLVVAEYPKRKCYWNSSEVEDSHYFHLLEKNKKYYGKEKTFDQQYVHNENSETYLVEFLKNLQKGAK